MASQEFNEQGTESFYYKLDHLQRVVESLPERIAVLLQEQPSTRKSRSTSGGAGDAQSMISKDVLNDDEPAVYQPGANGRVLSPEAQIQRLTAQLTAAYNRIAALEEQLLSKRNLV